MSSYFKFLLQYSWILIWILDISYCIYVLFIKHSKYVYFYVVWAATYRLSSIIWLQRGSQTRRLNSIFYIMVIYGELPVKSVECSFLYLLTSSEGAEGVRKA